MSSYIKICISAFVLLSFGGVSICLAQNESKSKYTKKGILISKGKNTGPVGELNVVNYRLELVELTEPFDLKDGKPPINNAFRLVIETKEPLEGTYGIWFDGFQHYAFQVKPNEFAIIIYARTLPDNKLTIGLSKHGHKELALRSVLPELLNVPPEYATSFEELEAQRPIIGLRRLPQRNTFIELTIDIPGNKCDTLNIPYIIEIDGQNVTTMCNGYTFRSVFSNEEFARLRNGAEIVVKRGSGRSEVSRGVVGILDKSLVR